MRGCRRKETASRLILLSAQFLLFHTINEGFGLGTGVEADETSISSGPDDERFGLSTNTADQDISDIPSTSLPEGGERLERSSPVGQETSEISSTSLPHGEVSSGVTGEHDQHTSELQSTSLPAGEEPEVTARATRQQTSETRSTRLPGGEVGGQVADILPQDENSVEVADSTDEQAFYTQTTVLPTREMQGQATTQVNQQASRIPLQNLPHEAQGQKANQESQQTAAGSSSSLAHGAQGQLADRINEINQKILGMPSVFLDPLAQITLLMESHSLTLTAEQHSRAHACCKSGSTSCPEGCTIKKSAPPKDDTENKSDTFSSDHTTVAQA